MLRFGPETGPVVVVAMPLFEEANRCRAFAVTICRALSERGVGSVLPDVPGQGESGVATDHMTLADLRNSFGAVIESLHRNARQSYSASIRTGAIIDMHARSIGRWSFSPRTGRHLMAELGKVLAASGRNADALNVRTAYQVEDELWVEVAGNRISLDLLRDLTTDAATDRMDRLGIPSRVLRLETDSDAAHRHVPGTPLWRRAEPDNDPALAALLADDIADWIAHCEA